jgi:Zinc knuckle
MIMLEISRGNIAEAAGKEAVGKVYERQGLSSFQQGLKDDRVKMAVIAARPTTLADALNIAVSASAATDANGPRIKQETMFIGAQAGTSNCYRCGKTGHIAKDCRSTTRFSANRGNRGGNSGNRGRGHYFHNTQNNYDNNRGRGGFGQNFRGRGNFSQSFRGRGNFGQNYNQNQGQYYNHNRSQNNGPRLYFGSQQQELNQSNSQAQQNPNNVAQELYTSQNIPNGQQSNSYSNLGFH